MKLYEVLRNSLVRPIADVSAPPGSRQVGEGEVVHFYHIDGMYSYCKDMDGNIVHLPAWQEVEVVDG